MQIIINDRNLRRLVVENNMIPSPRMLEAGRHVNGLFNQRWKEIAGDNEGKDIPSYVDETDRIFRCAQNVEITRQDAEQIASIYEMPITSPFYAYVFSVVQELKETALMVGFLS